MRAKSKIQDGNGASDEYMLWGEKISGKERSPGTHSEVEKDSGLILQKKNFSFVARD